ncbi:MULTISPECIES: ABC transporter substrate-binding protein [unclassified Microbacterium]|uniref:ABC transporter substrate-binding protein n=1 Tax=unclassified Microbacterium TaxID=2609290 RepID=UPI00214B5349|nr:MULTISPECIES: ABC transporter substrate-binding protein [unclassified Microbacterium]MCR2811289.1 ABC transporter substrate-binding protein [Microbacterium sp. zg.B185]WIM19447.1 ABC transporter substrate-binding protein [Microbacterium sp. zg-B185]
MTSHHRKGGVLAILAGAALILAGCSTAGAGPATDNPVEGGTITVAIDGDPSSQFDIHVTAADISALVLRNVFDSLVVQDTDGSIQPWLAESWEVSDDGLEYTFQLKEDVTFSDGEPFNADAVKANFDHIADPETASQYAAALLGGDAYAGTEAVDADTVKVSFTRPFAPFLQGASTAYLGFYSPKVLEESPDKLIAGGPGITVGTGPFILESVVAGQDITLTKNPDYNWGPANATHSGAAHPDELVYRILPENAVRAGALTSGEVDVASNVSPNDVPALEVDGTVSVTGTGTPGLPYSIFLNHSKGVFQDKLVRQAFQQGIDIGSAVTAVYGGEYDRAWSVLGPTTPNAYDPTVEGSWEYDEDLANQLLDDAGWTERDTDDYRTKDGVRLSAEWPSYSAPREDRKSLIDAFQADLKKIGFELNPNPLDGGAYIESLYGGTYDIADWSFVRPEGDILRLHLYSGFAPVQNASFVNDPELDDLLVTASESTDPDERKKIYSEVQHWAIEDAAIVPIYVPSHIIGVSSTIGGVRADITGWPLLYDAWTSRQP